MKMSGTSSTGAGGASAVSCCTGCGTRGGAVADGDGRGGYGELTGSGGGDARAAAATAGDGGERRAPLRRLRVVARAHRAPVRGDLVASGSTTVAKSVSATTAALTAARFVEK